MEKLKGTWKHQYIIAPVTGQAQIKKDQCGSPLRTRSRPRLTCDIIFHEVLLTLNDVSNMVLINRLADCVLMSNLY